MRITSTTSSPVITNERTAAGPAALMTTPLPTKRPAPMTPPRAIIIMCRCLRLWRSPLEGSEGALTGVDNGLRGNGGGILGKATTETKHI
jgi:hypothetical protein